MILVNYEKVSEDKAKVLGTHHKPEMLTKEETSKGILLEGMDNLPKAPSAERGKIATLMVNLDTNEFYWEIEDRPLNQEELLESMLEKMDELAKKEDEIINLLKNR